MSDLYRSALQARIAKLPMLPPEDGEDDEESELADSIGSLPTGFGPAPMPSRSTRTKRAPNVNFAPISAAGYFEQATQADVSASGLDVRAYYTPPKFADGTVMVFHHGAGQSALTFACVAKEVTEISRGECGVLALDCRGHGKTARTTDTESTQEDFAIETLTTDLVNALKVIYPDPATAPTLLLAGHSLGGSVIVRACPLLQEANYRITGVAVLDIVEEFTLEALPMMNSLLDARPEGFDSQEAAIEWHVRTNAIRNPDSARVSIPAIIKPAPPDSPLSSPAFVWRTPLRSTAPYWTSWFTGLSGKFLAARTARLLVLAGAERLDKELMIGQMQGKFQLVVIPGVGHMLQEDDPTRLAEVLVEFWRRNERVIAGVKKVGER
ncbi:protein phosphatase methylesterase [Wolfiporia cocos MD-104 SS10]|uniref:Protein phosphatase methylesterase 1 n=1 Tax=Wolfiporia cocos (strain MD-104) TaxID=742152 RepID=A0A2H3JUK4_WOLCO|nr:protein phosphatase methylesterase [Wolfiporia cocos MD-104 SS10]